MHASEGGFAVQDMKGQFGIIGDRCSGIGRG
jgi:hypothetical protein